MSREVYENNDPVSAERYRSVLKRLAAVEEELSEGRTKDPREKWVNDLWPCPDCTAAVRPSDYIGHRALRHSEPELAATVELKLVFLSRGQIYELPDNWGAHCDDCGTVTDDAENVADAARWVVYHQCLLGEQSA